MPQKNEERLQKYLAECGVASRRKSEELIAAGGGRKCAKLSGITIFYCTSPGAM